MQKSKGFHIRLFEKVSSLYCNLIEYLSLHPGKTGLLVISIQVVIFTSLITITLRNSHSLQGVFVYISPEKKEPANSGNVDLVKHIKAIKKDISTLERKRSLLIPASSYLVVNTSDNKFKLYRYRQLSYEGVCSTGSYIMLEADSTQKWIFKTPRGIYRIQGKTESPVWRKPDWAFIEEGLPVPHPYASERYEYGVLGDYALSLGDGYLIHGTLYTRQLGMPVTHGCIRMGDEELEKVFYSLQYGSKVYIF